MGDRLKEAAAEPTRGLDFPRARRRGLIQRTVALTLATLGVASVVAGAAVAYPQIVDTTGDERVIPPGTVPCTPPRGDAPLAGSCGSSGTSICPPSEWQDLETFIRPPKDGDGVDHFGVYVEIEVSAHDPGCAPTIYVEFDGYAMVPVNDVLYGPELSRANSDQMACLVTDRVAGNLFYSGRHAVGIGTGCDPTEAGPYATQRWFEFDGERRSLIPSRRPLEFCDDARYLDELRRPPTDDELDDLLASAPEDIRDETAALVESARQFRDGDDAPSMTDEVQEAADRFDEYVAREC